MARRFILDFGNWRWKWFVPRGGKGESFSSDSHAIVQLSENEWRRVVGRGKPTKGLIRVNGVPYAVGDAARRHVISERPMGAARYTETYYGTGLAYALSEAFQQSVEEISLFASHPPGDQPFAGSLVRAARHEWVIECQYGELRFGVKTVGVFDEPLGGYFNKVLTERGEEVKKNPLRNITTLVIDVGGWTTDVAPVDPGGMIDILGLKSTRRGLKHLVDQFETDLRTNNRTRFQNTGDIDPRRIEDAIRKGVFMFGSIPIPCEDEAAAAINMLVNDVIQVIEAAGGAANFDAILLTGGGAALIYEALKTALPTIKFYLATDDISTMMYANVFGGGKMMALLRNYQEV